jgi:hypothetical protein
MDHLSRLLAHAPVPAPVRRGLLHARVGPALMGARKLLELARLYGVDSLLPPAVSGNELEHRAATVPAADRA